MTYTDAPAHSVPNTLTHDTEIRPPRTLDEYAPHQNTGNFWYLGGGQPPWFFSKIVEYPAGLSTSLKSTSSPLSKTRGAGGVVGQNTNAPIHQLVTSGGSYDS